jgi:hypothetical protein
MVLVMELIILDILGKYVTPSPKDLFECRVFCVCVCVCDYMYFSLELTHLQNLHGQSLMSVKTGPAKIYFQFLLN